MNPPRRAITLTKAIYFPFEFIEVNRYDFRLDHARSSADRKIYYPTSEISPVPSIFSVRPLRPSGKAILDGFLPQEILVDNRSYLKRFGNYYTPRDATPAEVRDFFDYISSVYDSLIDTRLNSTLIHRLLARFKSLAIKHHTPGLLRILDYGSGTGLSYQLFKENRGSFWNRAALYGCDLSPRMVATCRRKGFVNARECEYARTDYSDRMFDCLIASFVAHYFIDERPYYEFHRLLRPGGICLFNLHKPQPNFEHQYTYWLTTVGFPPPRFTTWKIATDEGEKVLFVVEAVKEGGKGAQQRIPPAPTLVAY